MPNCEIRPHYGYDGEAPRFCAQHRAEGMHNLRSRRCQVCNFVIFLLFVRGKQRCVQKVGERGRGKRGLTLSAVLVHFDT